MSFYEKYIYLELYLDLHRGRRATGTLEWANARASKAISWQKHAPSGTRLRQRSQGSHLRSCHRRRARWIQLTPWIQSTPWI